MDIDFGGEAYPSRDERSLFGYSPDSIHVLSPSSGSFGQAQKFKGKNASEVLDSFENGFIGFEYVNEEVSPDREVSSERSVPEYQREAFPAELRPSDEWIGLLNDIEETNESVADTFLSANVHDNGGYFRRVENLAEDLSEPIVTAAPDIQGLRAVSYAPDRMEADIIQYREELEVPTEPTDHPPGAMVSDTDHERVDHPRDEEKIRELVDAHDDWEVDKITLPVYEAPPELRPENDN